MAVRFTEFAAVDWFFIPLGIVSCDLSFMFTVAFSLEFLVPLEHLDFAIKSVGILDTHAKGVVIEVLFVDSLALAGN